jgi:hypothetical protein
VCGLKKSQAAELHIYILPFPASGVESLVETGVNYLSITHLLTYLGINKYYFSPKKEKWKAGTPPVGVFLRFLREL